jgi:hypothetical protein
MNPNKPSQKNSIGTDIEIAVETIRRAERMIPQILIPINSFLVIIIFLVFFDEHFS